MSEVSANPPLLAGCSGGNRPYHHGDLRRALVEAARVVLERDGPQALSLRAVAREAGVSPAAPYHHFKDKCDLLTAVAEEGFHGLALALKAGHDADPEHGLTAIGLAYVRFAKAHPDLYRVMYDSARNADAMPESAHAKDEGGFQIVKIAMIKAGLDPSDEVGLELACIAAWCAAHGLAEMSGFAQFGPLIEHLGGEDAFLRAVLERLGLSGKAKA